MTAEKKWAKAVEIIDNGDLTQTETLVALGILRHSDDNLTEAAPGGAALAHYGRVKKRSAIAKAIAGLKAKGIVRNRHAGFHARVFTFADEVAAAVIAYREALPVARPTPPTCTPEGNNNVCPSGVQHEATVYPSGEHQPHHVYPSGEQQLSVTCTPKGNNNSACCTPQGDNNVCPSGVQQRALLLLPSEDKGRGGQRYRLADSDLLGGRGPVVGVEFPTALIEAIERGRAKATADVLVDAVRAEIRAGAHDGLIERALRDAVAAAFAEDKAPSDGVLLKKATTFVNNARRLDAKARACDAHDVAKRKGGRQDIPTGKVEPLQPVAWEP